MARRFTRIAALGTIAATALAGISAGTAGATTYKPRVVVHQKGINTFAPDSCSSTTTWATYGVNEAASIKALGANTVAFAVPFYTTGMSSNVFQAVTCETHPGSSQQTPSPARLAVLVDAAHAAGLKVFIRPLLDETNLITACASCYRGTIHPTNLKAWFANYMAALTPYLKMAQAHHVEHFAIATELNSLSHNKSWAKVIASAKKSYTGDLAFATLWQSDHSSKSWKGTSNGFDAYQWAAGSTSESTPAQLLTMWNASLKRAPIVPALSSEVIDEVGIPAENGAYLQPWRWYLDPKKYPFNQTIQQNWFTTACNFAKSHSMQGIYYWGPAIYEGKGNFLKVANPSQPANLQPLGQAAIKSCFTSIFK